MGVCARGLGVLAAMAAAWSAGCGSVPRGPAPEAVRLGEVARPEGLAELTLETEGRLVEEVRGSETFLDLGADLLARDRGDPPGLRVHSVREGGPAAKAGLRRGDRLVSVAGGNELSIPSDLEEDLAACGPGKAVRLAALRGGERLDLEAVPAEATRHVRFERTRTLPQVEDDRHFGVALCDLPPEEEREVFGPGAAGPLVTGVYLGSPAYLAGVRRGDRVLAVDGEPAGDAEALARRLRRARGGDRVTLRVKGPLGDHEAEMTARDDLGRHVDARFALIGGVERTAHASVCDAAAGILFHREAAFWPSADRRPAHAADFGILADLIHVEKRPGRTEVRLLWVIPIAF